jgi:hypothetical protein
MRAAVFCYIISIFCFYSLLLTKVTVTRPPGSKMDKVEKLVWLQFILACPFVTAITAYILGGRWGQDQHGNWLCTLNNVYWQLSAFHALCDLEAVAVLLYLFLLPLYRLNKNAPMRASTNVDETAQKNNDLRNVIFRNVFACLCTVIPTALNIGFLIKACLTRSIEDALMGEIFNAVAMCSFVISALISTFPAWIWHKKTGKSSTLESAPQTN